MENFSAKWKADSLGIKTFRVNYINNPNDEENWLINGVNFLGFTKRKVIDILGKANKSGLAKEDRCLIMSYITSCENRKPKTTLLIYFDKNDLVIYVIPKSEIVN